MKKSTKVKTGVLAGVAAAAAATTLAAKRASKKYETTDGHKINTSESLTEELERETGEEVQRINTMGGTFGNYSRRDKSWDNVGDFFGQMIKGRTK